MRGRRSRGKLVDALRLAALAQDTIRWPAMSEPAAREARQASRMVRTGGFDKAFHTVLRGVTPSLNSNESLTVVHLGLWNPER
jgi:hypothetical protein